MEPKFFNRNHLQTAYVRIDTSKCKACWKCLKSCPNGVIGKLDLPFHKHIILKHNSDCTGCLNCQSTCPHDVFAVKAEEKPVAKSGKSILYLILFFSAFFMILSGLVLQFGYHVGSRMVNIHQHTSIPTNVSAIERSEMFTGLVLGYSYRFWSIMHKISICLFTLFTMTHVYQQRKYYKQKFFNSTKRTMLLTAIFILTALTGFVPWLIGAFQNTGKRFLFIEIHDKLAFLLLILLTMHLARKIRIMVSAKKI